MRNTKYLAVVLTGILWGCGPAYQKPADPTEAGRDFLNATLKADYNVADQYIPKDKESTESFDRYKKWYVTLPDSARDGYRQASLIIYKISKPDDSTAIISFANSYINKKQNIRLFRNDGQWWVDFAYTFADTTAFDSTAKRP